MSNVQHAMISWISPQDGGRSRPPSGPTYSTLARFEEDRRWPDESWSLWVEFEKSFRDSRLLLAKVRFLVDEAPHCLLHEGSRFELYEGAKRVAKGVILPAAISVPQEISDFECALIG